MIVLIGYRSDKRVWISTDAPTPSCGEDLGLGSIKYFSASLSKHISFFGVEGGSPMQLEGLHESLGFSENPKSRSQNLFGSHGRK